MLKIYKRQKLRGNKFWNTDTNAHTVSRNFLKDQTSGITYPFIIRSSLMAANSAGKVSVKKDI